MPRILALIFTLVICAMSNLLPASGENEKWFYTLMQAHEFANGEIGEGPHPSACYLAYREALVEPEKVTDQELHALLTGATAEGKLFAGCISYYVQIARKHESQKDAALKNLTTDQTRVFYRSGCRGINATVGEVASSLLKERKFLNFELEDLSKIKSSHGIPNSILKLSSAKRLESAVIGEGAQSVLYAYYKEACHLPLQTNGWEITWLRRNGTPAGRLYGCFLALRIDAKVGTDYFRELEKDTAKVQYQSGCEVENFTLGAIARQVVEKHKFADFSF